MLLNQTNTHTQSEVKKGQERVMKMEGKSYDTYIYSEMREVYPMNWKRVRKERKGEEIRGKSIHMTRKFRQKETKKETLSR